MVFHWCLQGFLIAILPKIRFYCSCIFIGAFSHDLSQFWSSCYFSGSIESVSSIDVPDSPVVSSLNSGPDKSLGSEVIEKSRVLNQFSYVLIKSVSV
jgi:hypothetical protein